VLDLVEQVPICVVEDRHHKPWSHLRRIEAVFPESTDGKRFSRFQNARALGPMRIKVDLNATFDAHRTARHLRTMNKVFRSFPNVSGNTRLRSKVAKIQDLRYSACMY
jgi:hypothetical protein